jgi:Tol biopolymer transport system component
MRHHLRGQWIRPAVLHALLLTIVVPVAVASTSNSAGLEGSPPTARAQPDGPHFVPVDPPRYTGAEPAHPYEEPRSHVPLEWQLLLVRGDAEPELLYQTGRYLVRADWSPDGRELVAVYETFGQPEPGTEDEWRRRGFEAVFLEFAYLRGLVSFDVSVSPPTGREELITNHFPRLGPSPDHSRIALQRDEEMGRRTVYTIDRAGRAVRLDGVGDHPGLYGFLPDSSGLLVQVPIADSPDRSRFYLVPFDGRPATRFEVPLGRGFVLSLEWSPEGGRLAYRIAGDLYLFDRATGDVRLLASNPDWRGRDPHWSRNGAEIILGGNLIDAATGRVLVSLGAPYPAADAALSADGRYFAVAEDPTFASVRGQEFPCPPAPGEGPLRLNPDNRVFLHDRQTGETRLLQECGQGLTAHLQWLADGRHLIISQQPEQAPVQYARGYSLTLVDIETGRKTPLTDGRELHADAIVSPRGDRVIVVGERLRLYTSTGELLREIVPPEGFDVPMAVWSPDGSSFAYVLGPAGWFPVYP